LWSLGTHPSTCEPHQSSPHTLCTWSHPVTLTRGTSAWECTAQRTPSLGCPVSSACRASWLSVATYKAGSLSQLLLLVPVTWDLALVVVLRPGLTVSFSLLLLLLLLPGAPSLVLQRPGLVSILLSTSHASSVAPSSEDRSSGEQPSWTCKHRGGSRVLSV
jgi:hypothetical protein